jgi:hypothetical protein
MLLHLLTYSIHRQGCENYPRSVRCLKLCFRLLEDPGTDRDQVRSTDVAVALRLNFVYSVTVEEHEVWTCLYRKGSNPALPHWGGLPDWHTQAQFDLLVDHLVQAGQGTDYIAIGDAFAVLAGLRGSPSTIERKRLYIQTMIRFMGLEFPLRTRRAALCAAYALRTNVVSMDRDDEPLRYLFSRALIPVMRRARDHTMHQHTSMSIHDNLTDLTIELLDVNWNQNRCYLGLLCALSREATWHGHLNHHGHFKICLAIADSLSSHVTEVDNSFLAMHLTHIFAIVDDLGEDHKFLRAVRMYQIWPLILLAWHYMFKEPFFYDTTMEKWEELSSLGIVESLPTVASYAMKYWEQWDNREEAHRLIQLVKQVCDKLDEEQSRNEQSIPPVELGQGNDTFGHRGILNLSEEIRMLLVVLWRDMSR